MNRPVRPLRCSTAGRLAAFCLLLAVLALVPGAPALAAGTPVAGTSVAGGAVAPGAPPTVATTVPTIATTTPTIATSTPAAPSAAGTTPVVPANPGAATTLPGGTPVGGTTVPGSQTLRTPAPTKKSGGGKLSGGAILAAILAGLIALACLVWGIFRIGAFEPRWLLSARHSVAEAGFRAAGTWDEFTDWLRLGH